MLYGERQTTIILKKPGDQMIEHIIKDGTEVGIKIFLSLATLAEPPLFSLSKALQIAAKKANCGVSFEEGREIAVGESSEINNCAKAVFFPLNEKSARIKDSMQKLDQIAAEFIKLDRILIHRVVGTRVIQVKTEETGGEILTIQNKEERSRKVKVS